MSLDVSRPVLLLGGKENSLSVVRHLGRLGIDVRVSGPPGCWGLYSRYCRQALKVPKDVPQSVHWKRLLLERDTRFDGHILIALSDDALEFLADHRDALKQRYLLDDVDPELQKAFLDKQAILDMARKAGVGAPQYWPVTTAADIEKLDGRIRFPVMAKPRHSHKFAKAFGRKLFIVEDSFEQLEERLRMALDRGLEMMVVEMIPGPDDLLSSYYTYIGRKGEQLFDYTKRVIRRWPVNRGNACHHESVWLSETAEAGRRFFQAVGLKGLGNIEFKRDLRDGELKIIEVNARMTAAQELVRRAGVPIDLVIYCHLTRQPIPHARQARDGLRMWYPFRDFLSALSLFRARQLGLPGYLMSLPLCLPVLPLASLGDPLPMFGAFAAFVGRLKLVWK
jgi:predicted ATP-grasp superfamily ATP-dependent carboligase